MIFGSAIFFALLHLHVGWTGPLTVLPGALVFSWCWWVQWHRSLGRAYWMTTVLHAAHNAIALLIYAIAT
jgi:hypothetical protein